MGNMTVGLSAAVQHVRHIAALGLPDRMAVAAMVDAIEEVVPTRTRTFLWADDDGMPCDTYDRDLIPSVIDEFNEHAPKLAADPNAPSLDKMLNSRDEFGGWLRFQALPGWDRSALKNIIFRAYGIGNNLDFPIRDARGRAGSILTLGREPGSRPYTRREISAVLSLRPHFLHAIESHAALSAAENCGPDGEVEIVMIGQEGTICTATDRGLSLLYQLKPPSPLIMKIGCDRAPAPVLEAIRGWTMQARDSMTTRRLWRVNGASPPVSKRMPREVIRPPVTGVRVTNSAPARSASPSNASMNPWLSRMPVEGEYRPASA
jgi:hypothetical protein